MKNKIDFKKKSTKREAGAVLFCLALILVTGLSIFGKDANWFHDTDVLNMLTGYQMVTVYDNNYMMTSDIASNIKSEYVTGDALNGNMMVTVYDPKTVRVYGPYIWLPKGEYKITATFNDGQLEKVSSMDVACARGSAKSNDIDLKGELKNEFFDTNGSLGITDIQINSDTLTYNLTTNGSRADFEFRFLYQVLDNDNPEYYSTDVKDYIKSFTIEANYNNSIKYNANGGVVLADNKATTGQLTYTTWGKARSAVAKHATRTGYNFLGWTTYGMAENLSTERSKLTFTGNKDDVTIWDCGLNPSSNGEYKIDGTTIKEPNSNTEYSYYTGNYVGVNM